MMKKRSLLFISLLLCLAVAACKGKSEEEKGPPEKGDKAVDIKVRDFDGKTVSLSQFNGKVVILNFWATWCPPCREEMPSMEALYKKFSTVAPEQKKKDDKDAKAEKKSSTEAKSFTSTTTESKKMDGQDVVMLLVSIDENVETVKEFIKKNNYTMPVYHDPNKDAGSAYGITGVPETFIIDKSGMIAEKVIGPIDWMSPDVLKFIQDLRN